MIDRRYAEGMGSMGGGLDFDLDGAGVHSQLGGQKTEVKVGILAVNR